MWVGEAGEQNNKVLVSSRGTGTGDVWKATCGGCFTKGDQDVPEMQELTMEQGDVAWRHLQPVESRAAAHGEEPTQEQVIWWQPAGDPH